LNFKISELLDQINQLKLRTTLDHISEINELSMQSDDDHDHENMNEAKDIIIDDDNDIKEEEKFEEYEHNQLPPLQLPDVDDVPETQLMIARSDSLQISVNGTPITPITPQNCITPETASKKQKRMTHETILSNRKSIAALMDKKMVTELTGTFNKRNQQIALERVDEDHDQFPFGMLKSPEEHNDLKAEHSLSHSHSLKKTYKAKHKHKRKDPKARKVKSVAKKKGKPYNKYTNTTEDIIGGQKKQK